MTIYLRDKDDTNIVDCEIFETRGKVRVHLTIPKSWDYSVELKELKAKCKALDGVSAIDDALNEVTKTLSKFIKQISIKINLRYVED